MDSEKCVECGVLTDEYSDCYSPYVINDGLEGEYTICFQCHCEMTDEGRHTNCESCGEYFTYDKLQMNEHTGIIELCSYCNEVWCG